MSVHSLYLLLSVSLRFASFSASKFLFPIAVVALCLRCALQWAHEKEIDNCKVSIFTTMSTQFASIQNFIDAPLPILQSAPILPLVAFARDRSNSNMCLTIAESIKAEQCALYVCTYESHMYGLPSTYRHTYIYVLKSPPLPWWDGVGITATCIHIVVVGFYFTLRSNSLAAFYARCGVSVFVRLLVSVLTAAKTTISPLLASNTHIVYICAYVYVCASQV